LRPSALYSVIAVLSWPVLHGLYRLRARGLEHLPREGGFVLACNHVSSFDPWPIGLPLWPRRFLRFMAKSELYWWPLTYVLNGAGAFPVRRGQRDAQAIENAVSLVRQGYAVAMFPEGTRRAKGLVKRFEARPRSGAARIALEAGSPLVPAAVAGTDRAATAPAAACRVRAAGRDRRPARTGGRAGCGARGDAAADGEDPRARGGHVSVGSTELIKERRRRLRRRRERAI
jgi:1-acyl-sn-glycerol-3-phosphate acyltransferase